MHRYSSIVQQAKEMPPTLSGSAALIFQQAYGITTIVPCIIAPWIRQ
jgi:hypothetical protein